MNYYKVLILFILLSSPFVSADDGLKGNIRLQGSYNFKEIILETEKQLDIEIILPTPPDTSARKNYKPQSIALSQLVKAIMHNYAQDKIPVNYSYTNDVLKFYRTDTIIRKKYNPPAKKSPTPTHKKNTYSPPKSNIDTSIFDHNRRPKKVLPAKPDWVKIKAIEHTHSTTHQKKAKTQLDDLDDLPPTNNKGFTVVMPKEGSQTFMATKPTQYKNINPIKQNYRSPQSSPSKNSKNQSSSIKSITPYPEGASAFINDAPSITSYTGTENYVEWETRMRGALIQGNDKVLVQEKEELEKRLRWIKNNL